MELYYILTFIDTYNVVKNKNMKPQSLTLLIPCLLISLTLCAQKGKINGRYVWDMVEYLTITEDSFRLTLYPIYPFLYGLDSKDTILSEGRVRYESDRFIQLTSKNYELEASKNMTITESVDSLLKNNLRFIFHFPFDGEYKIRIGNNYHFKYEFKSLKEVIIPVFQDSIWTFSFEILNQTPIGELYRNYLRKNGFSSFRNTAKNKNSNSFEIFIPDLTNSYFNRLVINGEYLKVEKDKSGLYWRNERYWKFGDGIR